MQIHISIVNQKTVNFPWHFCCAYVLENREKSKEQHLKFLPVLVVTYSRV